MGYGMKNETEFIFDEVLQEGFTTIPNAIFNSGVSYKAVGLYTSILRVKNIPNWKIYQSNLITEKDKKSSVASAMKELIEAKFIEKIALRDDHGRMRGVAYKVYCSPKPDFPTSEKPTSENQPLKNKDNKNKDNNIYSDSISRIISLYPGKKIKAIRDKKLPGIIKKYGEEQIINCVTRYAAECKGKDKKYILNESTFWNGRYMDYLDCNFEDVQPVITVDGDGIREF